jgi:predicted aspartyl protease
MTISYDFNHDPPAPVLVAVLTGMVHRRPQVRLPALIDTGSDLTAIPHTVVKRLHLYAVARIKVEGIDAYVTSTEIYTVRLAITGQPVREMEVVQTEQPFVILGRDWLEHYYLLLNGPERNFLLSDRPLSTEA